VHEINLKHLIEYYVRTGVEVNTEKMKCMAMFGETSLAGQDHNRKAGNKIFERVKQFRYFGTSLTN
jgi:hypothetical protein